MSWYANNNAAPPVAPPAAPGGLGITLFGSGQEYQITWTPPPGATGQRVEISEDGGAFALFDTVGAAVASFNDVTNYGVPAAMQRAYRIVAFNAGGDSPPSNVVYTHPVRPSVGVDSLENNDPGSVTLFFGHPAQYAAGWATTYEVQSREGAGEWGTIANSGPPTATSLTGGHGVSFGSYVQGRCRAQVGSFTSEWSDETDQIFISQ